MPPRTPKFTERIDAFAGSLVRFGVPPQGSFYQAHGIVHMVLRYCERHHTDWLGTAADVDGLLQWARPPQVIAPAMAKAGLLCHENREYFFPYAWPLCSHNVKKLWCDTSRESYEIAKKRHWAVDNTAPADELTEEPDRDLFGEPVDDKPKKKPTDTPLGYNTIVAIWLREWSAKYGARYTFRPRDGATIKRLLRASDADTIERAIKTYLACDRKFWAGHELTGLYTGFNQWSAGDRSGAGEHGITYARAEEDLPTTEL